MDQEGYLPGREGMSSLCPKCLWFEQEKDLHKCILEKRRTWIEACAFYTDKLGTDSKERTEEARIEFAKDMVDLSNESITLKDRITYENFLDKIEGKEKKVDKKTTLEDAIAMADKCRKEIVLCLLGAPGIGKTQAVYDFARKNGRKVVEIIASQILPNEVSGITMPVQESKSMEIFDHARLSSLRDGDILFFDELLQAAPSTLSACLTLIQERRLMSGRKLPDVLIIAASNPLAHASMTPLSIRQRFLFYNCTWDKKAWMQWIKDNLGYTVTSDLVSRIRTEGEQMNVFTPRSCTKMLQWIKDTDGDPATYEAIEHIFGENVATSLRRTARTEDPLQKTIHVAKNFYHDRGETLDVERLQNCTAEEMLELLQSLPDFDELAKILSETEVIYDA